MGDKVTAAPRDRMKGLLEGWDGTTRVWTPTADKGYNPKSVTGELLRVEEWDTQHGPARVAIIIDDFDALETAIFTNSIALDRQWQNQAPSDGDRIGVAFGGQEEGKNGMVYNRFKLMVERVVFQRDTPAVVRGDLPVEYNCLAPGDVFADQ